MRQLSLHSISGKLVFYLLSITQNTGDAEMVAYGMEIFLGSLLKIIILFVTAAFLGIVNEVALLLAVTGILRTFSGGAHCTAYYRCMLTSTLVMITLGLTVKAASRHLANSSPTFLVLLLSVSFYLYWMYSPQASMNKPLPDNAAEKRFRLVVAAIAIVFSFISLVLGTSSRISWCIAFGMLWQAITLTGSGHKIVSLFDSLLTVKQKEVRLNEASSYKIG